jgi:uncharacterized membrane protein (UPF0127 family)
MKAATPSDSLPGTGSPGPGLLSPRLARLPRTVVLGKDVPVAGDRFARLLGLAYLTRAEAGTGLLIPRCSSIHTFGMRFVLDVVFLDERWQPLALHRAVARRRFLWRRGAAAVLELPAEVPPASTADGNGGAAAVIEPPAGGACGTGETRGGREGVT